MAQETIFSVTLDSSVTIITFDDIDSCIIGYEASDLIGKNWFEVFIPESNEQEMQKVFDGFFKGDLSFWEHENEITCKDGTKRLLKWENSLKRDAHDYPVTVYSQRYLD